MGFFTGRRDPQAAVRCAHAEDPLVIEIGQTTDQVLRNMLHDSRESSNYIRQYLAEQRETDAAWWAAHRRRQAEDL